MPLTPGEMAGVGAGMQGVGSLMSAYGQYEAGQANAAILRMNAAYARTQSAQAMESGEYRAGIADLKETQIAGSQATSFAGQGVVSGAGSAGTVVQSGEAVSMAEKAMIRLNAQRQAYGYEVAASNDDFQADMAKRQGIMGAESSLISGVGSLAMTAAIFA